MGEKEWWESTIDFKVGQTYRARLYHSSNYYKIHIVGIVEHMVVYRYYGKYKQWWHYKIELPINVERQIELGKEEKSNK